MVSIRNNNTDDDDDDARSNDDDEDDDGDGDCPLSGEFTGHRWIPLTKGQ